MTYRIVHRVRCDAPGCTAAYDEPSVDYGRPPAVRDRL